MASKVSASVEVKTSPENFWNAIRKSTELFPKVFPEEYKSIEVIEGDGLSAGSIRLVKYAEGVEIVTFSKEKVEEADDANKLVSYSVLEGELVILYKPLKVTVSLVPKGEGSLVQWSLEYDKTADEVPEPHNVKDAAIKTFTALDAYLSATTN